MRATTRAAEFPAAKALAGVELGAAERFCLTFERVFGKNSICGSLGLWCGATRAAALWQVNTDE